MNKKNNAIIIYRIQKADEALDLAYSALEKNYWNSVASQLYYTCFYLIIALFEKYNITTKTHSGVKTAFALHFIKQNKIEVKWGKLLATLFDARGAGDYGDFVIFTKEEIFPLLKEVEDFRIVIKELIVQKENEQT